MSHDPLVDTVHDLRLEPDESSRPWRLTAAIGWSAALAATVGGCWLAVLILSGLAWHSTDIGELTAGRLTTVGLLAGGGLTLGVLVGGPATLLRTKSVRSRIGETLGLAIATSVAGAICPLVAAATAALIPPLASSTLVWAVAGAVIGFAGYTWGREPGPARRPTEPADWSLAAAAGWAAVTGLSGAATWAGAVIGLRSLWEPVFAQRLTTEAAIDTAEVSALAGCLIGLFVGIVSGLFVSRPPSLAAGLRRGGGFSVGAAIGGGLFPFVVNVTAPWIAPEVSSTACWGVVGAIAGFVAYSLGQRAPRDADVPVIPLTEEEGILIPAPVLRPAATPLGPAPAGVLSGSVAEPELIEEPAAVLSGWDPFPEEVPGSQSGPRVRPTPGTATAAIVRVGPVLLVSAGCLLAVVLSAPSPVGWAMLAIGLMGLAVAWSLAGQERRIGELERRLREAKRDQEAPPSGIL